MENELLLLQTMAAFTGVAAIALLIMMGFMIGAYASVKKLQERSAQFMDRWEPVASTAQKTLDETREQTAEILKDVKALTESSRKQMEKVDGILDDVESSTKKQLERIDASLEINLRRVEDATAAVHKTVLVPVRQIRGVAAAVNAVLDAFAGRPRQPVDRATSDEEMFI